MRFFEVLWSEAVVAKTTWLLGLSVLLLFARSLALERPRFKSLVFFLATHLVLLFATAGLTVSGSHLAPDFRTPTWVFGAVAMVDAGSALLFAVVLPRVRLGVPRIVQDVLVAILSIVVAVGVASRAGVNLSGLIATSAVATAMLGFSLQDVIANVAGGLALQVDTSIEVGDWIKVNDVTGKVVEIRWRYTAIETRNWETVLIPNSMLMKSQVTVLGRRRGAPRLWRRWVWFSVDWRHQPSDVIEAIQGAVRGAKILHVAEEPAPNVVFMDMVDSVGRYALRYYLSDLAIDDPTDSEVRTRIYFALQRAGMSAAIPAHALFVTQESSDRTASKQKRELVRRKRMLEGCELFAAMSDEERGQLAAGLRYAPFTGGEAMTRQGAEAHWLYLIEDGTARVLVSDAGLEKEVAKLGRGSFFGEMSLLTGERRSATVVAEGDVECYRLDKASFQAVLEKRPKLAEDLAALLSRRKVELEAVRKGLDAESARRSQEREERDLLGRIRSFFRLD